MRRDFQWDRFFSSLAFAEKAAAEQCELIAEAYGARGDRAHEAIYRGYAKEEREHFELVSRVCRDDVPPPERAMAVYRGELLSPTPSLAERLATVHLGFEPSALAFLGHFYENAHRILADQERVREVRSAFREILRDEVTHVYQGRKCFELEWQRADATEKAEVLRSLRRHRAFLRLGLKSFFHESGASSEDLSFVQAMLADYRARVDRLCQDLAA